MKRQRQIAFGCVNKWDNSPHVSAWTIKGYAHQVRKEVGEAYREDGDSPAVGWAKALKSGMRLVKIEVRIIR